MSSLVLSTFGNLMRQASRTGVKSPYQHATISRPVAVNVVASPWHLPRRNLFWRMRRRAAEESRRQRMLARRVGRAVTVGSVVLSVCGIIGSSIATAMMGGAADEDEFLLDNLPVTPQLPRPSLPGPLVWPEEAATPCDRCTDEIADMLQQSMDELDVQIGGSPSGDYTTPMVTPVPMPIPTLPGHIQHHHHHEDYDEHYHLGEYAHHSPEAVNSTMCKSVDSPFGRATTVTIITTTITTSRGDMSSFHETLPPDNYPMRIIDVM